MASSSTDPRSAAEKEWFIVGRWEEFEGEGRANLLRLIGIAAFYAVELVTYYQIIDMPFEVQRPFHLAVTFLTLAWAMLCVGVLLCRQQKIFPAWLKYLSTGGDLVLLTSILTLADGPRSPLIVAYFLVIVLASLRFNLELIWFASGGAIAGYLWLLGYAKWGELPTWSKREDLWVPRYSQIIIVLALALTGVVLGQVIRRVRSVAEDYARRLEESKEGQA